MTETLRPEDLLPLRMRALGLSSADDVEGGGDGTGEASGPERIAGVARRMLALQGQDWRSSRWALGVRAPGTTMDDVVAAFQEGLIVRSWPMRGTIHVVPAEDIGWIQGVTGSRVLAGAAKRREFLGMSDAALDRLVAVSLEALAGGASLDRDELAAVWTEAGIEWRSNWRYHVIWWLCQNGLAVFGPLGGARPGESEPRLVLAEGWIRTPRKLEGDEALAALAHRYTAARGPIRVKDLAWWAGLTVRDAKRGLELATEADLLVPLKLEGVPGAAGALWSEPGALAGSAPRFDPEWRLLPSFDEHLLGYADREAQLAPEHFERIVPGRNGMFLATVVHDGRAVGTWRRARKGSGIEITELEEHAVDTRALGPQLERWAAFHGVETPALSIVPASEP